MYYFTISKTDGGNLIDSVCTDYEKLKAKFPDEVIYYSEDPILNIYISNLKSYGN